MAAINSAWVTDAGIATISDKSPSACAVFTLFRTYTWLAGFSPTITTASPGVIPFVFSSATRAATSSRT